MITTTLAFALAHIGAIGDDLGVVFRLEPEKKDGGIEPPRICDDDFHEAGRQARSGGEVKAEMRKTKTSPYPIGCYFSPSRMRVSNFRQVCQLTNKAIILWQRDHFITKPIASDRYNASKQSN